MIINYSPQLRGDALTLSKNGNILTINGEEIDFEPLESGTKLPLDVCQEYSPFLLGAQRNDGGELELTILLPHTPNATQAALFPQPVVNPNNGQIQIPS
jgi:hypothetical protein